MRSRSHSPSRPEPVSKKNRLAEHSIIWASSGRQLQLRGTATFLQQHLNITISKSQGANALKFSMSHLPLCRSSNPGTIDHLTISHVFGRVILFCSSNPIGHDSFSILPVKRRRRSHKQRTGSACHLHQHGQEE